MISGSATESGVIDRRILPGGGDRLPFDMHRGRSLPQTLKAV
jgi:hypothetical protein